MTKLGQADWLTAAATRAVIDALEAAQPGSARFVGGCVRNALMDRPVDDIDIATQLTPEQVIAALEAAGLRAIPTGLEHGTITAISDHTPYEITTLRRDVETDGRRAVVAFTEDWREDAERRDFRLNALYAEPDGTLHDPTGGGLDDAATGRVIFIGDADERLREDYLRILRFFRFNAWYGAEIDAAGLAACERQREGLEQIAAERIWKELKKLLGAPKPSAALEAMVETGVLAQILGEDWGGAQRTERLTALEATHDLSADPMQRFMTLIPCKLKTLQTLAAKLRLSNAELGRLLAWADPDLEPLGEAAPKAVRAACYTHGAQAVFDRAMVEAARSGAELGAPCKEICAAWTKPDLPIGGDDMLALGLQGRAVGDALKAAEHAWIDSDFTLSRDDLLKRFADWTPE